jgi:hypothetical protein
MSTATMPVTPTPSRRRILPVALVLTTVAFVTMFLGVYSVQPLGAIPDGVTAVVWRGSGEPFFNSPDALCLERMGNVSLMCRAMAMGQAPTERIVVRLPYQSWAYELSTDGRTFDR